MTTVNSFFFTRPHTAGRVEVFAARKPGSAAARRAARRIDAAVTAGRVTPFGDNGCGFRRAI